MNDKARELRETVMKDVRRKAERDFSDTRYNWLRTQQRRRQLVLVTVGVLLAYGVSMQYGAHGVTLAALVAYGVCLWLLRVCVRGVMDYPDEVVDERMRELRGYTYRYAFLGTVVLISAYLMLFIAHQLLSKWGKVAPMSADQVHNWAFVLFFAVIILPSAIHAWVEVDGDGDSA